VLINLFQLTRDLVSFVWRKKRKNPTLVKVYIHVKWKQTYRRSNFLSERWVQSAKMFQVILTTKLQNDLLTIMDLSSSTDRHALPKSPNHQFRWFLAQSPANASKINQRLLYYYYYHYYHYLCVWSQDQQVIN
jgi:hypothetical protein